MKEQYLEPGFVLDGEWETAAVTRYGEIPFSRTSGFTCNATVEFNKLEERDSAGIMSPLKKRPKSFASDMGFDVHEHLSPQFLDMFWGGGTEQRIDAYKTARRYCAMLNLRGDRPYTVPPLYSLYKSVGNPVFPPSAAPAISSSGAGSITGTTYAYVVPVYACRDPKYGVTITNLASFLTKTRGVDYILGTASSYSLIAAVLSSNAALVSWSAPSGGPRPTGYIVVLGTSIDITASGSFGSGGSVISAYVPYGTNSATIAAAGSTNFGAIAATSNFVKVLPGSIVSDTPTFGSPLVPGTDFSWDPTTGELARIAGGAIADGGMVQLNTWYEMDAEVSQSRGGSTIAERYVWLRGYIFEPSTSDVDTRRNIGAIIDFPKVNIANLPGTLINSKPGDFQDPLQVRNLEAMRCPEARGGIAIFRAFHPSFENLVDYYGADIAA